LLGSRRRAGELASLPTLAERHSPALDSVVQILSSLSSQDVRSLVPLADSAAQRHAEQYSHFSTKSCSSASPSSQAVGGSGLAEGADEAFLGDVGDQDAVLEEAASGEPEAMRRGW
jgi:hypothetical protein